MRQLNKDEKAVLVIGVLIIAILIGLGTTKSIWSKEKGITFNEKVDTVSLVAKEIELEAGNTLDPDIKKYLKGSDEDLKGFTLDVSKIDIKKTGTYTAYFKKNDKQFKMKVKVKDTLPPELTVAVNSMDWTLDGTGSIEDIKNTIQAKANDKADGDITSKITGWPEALPTEAQEVTYTLRVKDSAGHESTITFVVRYRLPANNQSGNDTGGNSGNNNTGGNNNQPEQPEQPDTPVDNPENPTE